MPRWAPLLVFLAAFIILSLQASRRGIGLGYLDPVNPVEAQDEAVYSHIALRMAERGAWDTPVFLDRYFLYKPPLLYWLSASSVKLLGASAFSLRLPSLLLGAAVCMLVYLWSSRLAGAPSGVVAVSLLLSSRMFDNLAGRNMTDMPVCAAIVAAIFLLARDPSLSTRASWIGFGSAVGMGILAKSTAGLIPFGALAAYALAARPPERPKARSVAGALCVAMLIAAPWFLYQYAAHPRWFWTEFVVVELLAWGAGAPPQVSPENAAAFYGLRMWRSSPALSVASAIGGLLLLRQLSRREPSLLIPAAWIATTAAAILAFRFHNSTYLLPLLPVLALAGATQLVPPRWGAASAILLLIWSSTLLQSPREFPPPTVAARRLLERRCQQGRSNELLIVSTADQFYATVLPFSRVRYVFSEQQRESRGLALDFRAMGIVVPVDEFLGVGEAPFPVRRRAAGMAAAGRSRVGDGGNVSGWRGPRAAGARVTAARFSDRRHGSRRIDASRRG